MNLTVAVKWHCAVLILFTLWISECAAQYTYDVYPVDTCPANENCLTLLDIVNDGDKYLTSHVTLVFHPGDHNLQDEAVSVANVSNLTLQGSTTRGSSGAPVTRIMCDNSILTFSSVYNLYIHSIDFVSCRSVLLFTVSLFQDCSFENSTAVNGGAMAVYGGSNVTFLGRTDFTGNTATWKGGAIYANNSIITFSGKTTFAVNHVLFAYFGRGGAVYADERNTLSFSGNSNFEGNTAEFDGGAMYAEENNTLNFSGNSNFEGNAAEFDGGAIYAEENNILSFSGNSNFEGNTADFDGGAMYALVANYLSFRGNNTFEGNRAKRYGGALFAYHYNYLSISGTNTFKENQASTGGSLHCFKSEIIFAGRTSFSSNTAKLFGGAIYAAFSVTQLNEFYTIAENEATYGGGGILVNGGTISFQGEGSCTENNATQYGYGGAILATSSVVAFSGSHQLDTNTAGFGGGMAIVGIDDGKLLLEPGTNLSLNGNIAHKRGGALYVKDNPVTYCDFNTTSESVVRDGCFLQFYDLPQYICDIASSFYSENTTGLQVYFKLNFENNSAVESGGDLYGGELDSCGVCVPDAVTTFRSVEGSEVFRQITNANMSSELEISSDPYRVCICVNNQANCSQTAIDVQKFPGQILSLTLASVGQMDGIVPSVIQAVPHKLTITTDFKVAQPAENNKDCTKLQYPVLSTEMNASLKLYSYKPCSTSGFPLTVHITFLPCPLGFTLSDQGLCICEERLQKFTQNCTIETLTIRRESGDSFWVGLQETSNPGLILHPHCPFDYCTEEAVDFTLSNTDLQCSTGRSGVLCGGCQSGHSLALGSSQCLSGCSNKSLVLLLAFAAAGVFLVAFLFLCRLTIAEGTLSGLIFYANVLAVNQNIFFPAGATNVLTVFISWLNLNLGIEVCFFEGLNAYSKTWLQFVFPIYIWVLAGIIIYLADVTTTFARIIGRTNPVAVLATLFLLSYTKLLQAIIVVLSFTTLDSPDGKGRFVWLYDGNIGYLDKQDGRHIVLFLVSFLVFLFVFLPYTLLLLCGQWIQRKFQLRWLSPRKRLYLSAFLDAYYAPFHDKHRYWTGLLLLLRFFIVLLTTIVNISHIRDPFVSLVVLLCVVSGILLWAWVFGRLYKRWYLNVLEASFMFNLIILIGGTYQVDRISGGGQTALVYTSVSIAFTSFIGMVISPVVKKVYKGKCPATSPVVTNGAHNSDDEGPLRSPVAAPPTSVVVIDRQHSQEDVDIRPLVESATY